MKATSLLEQQHRKIEAIFKRLEEGRSDAAPLVTELANDLTAHMVIEERLFYPAAREVKAGLVLEGLEEHAIARFALKRLLAVHPEDETFQAKVTALKEIIAHHVKEEEEELFPKVEKAMEKARLDDLGAEMKVKFDEVVEEGYEAVLTRTKTKSKRPVDGPNHRAAK
jgi:hemerythrin superfamily protein